MNKECKRVCFRIIYDLIEVSTRSPEFRIKRMFTNKTFISRGRKNKVIMENGGPTICLKILEEENYIIAGKTKDYTWPAFRVTHKFKQELRSLTGHVLKKVEEFEIEEVDPDPDHIDKFEKNKKLYYLSDILKLYEQAKADSEICITHKQFGILKKHWTKTKGEFVAKALSRELMPQVRFVID